MRICFLFDNNMTKINKKFEQGNIDSKNTISDLSCPQLRLYFIFCIVFFTSQRTIWWKSAIHVKRKSGPKNTTAKSQQVKVIMNKISISHIFVPIFGSNSYLNKPKFNVQNVHILTKFNSWKHPTTKILNSCSVLCHKKIGPFLHHVGHTGWAPEGQSQEARRASS